ncbi:NADPH:quinone reductase-like Zn-dependent oxidoreductase [Catenuloplanes nepalensis]|uniref:NADPH:quinone reductase-like Zn-dependent oxidoreductase n=1 Tax=Catenuloplanes nepalensis TaxID=587533 RepID=A0ABT9MUC0_9ACTN|nr:zinc-binding dehydrogenase [Catenuloplanes nepalensis]MDP9795037.1 NADPH:quinone reductase-like Zn-dependent oxidoreductase [Catenuloplanes nepalensis]
MKALLFTAHGGPEVLTVADIPAPHAGPGEIRIAVRAVGVSPADDALRSGAWKSFFPIPLPYVVGVDAAGVVDEIGAGVEGVRAGDEVYGVRVAGGTTAEHVVFDLWAAKPAAWTWSQAGGAAGGVATAAHALDELGVRAGSVLLLDGASGGVGAVAVQLAVARGARVIGTASPANHAFLRDLGAEPVTYGPGLAERVGLGSAGGAGLGSAGGAGLGSAGGAGTRVDAALDVGGHGDVTELVALTGTPDAVRTLVAGNAVHGVRLIRVDPAGVPAALASAARLADAGRLAVPIAAEYRITEGAAAHTRIARGHARGKVVITLGAE